MRWVEASCTVKTMFAPTRNHNLLSKHLLPDRLQSPFNKSGVAVGKLCTWVLASTQESGMLDEAAVLGLRCSGVLDRVTACSCLIHFPGTAQPLQRWREDS